MNATDPASLCGIQLDGLKHTFPKRLNSTHLAFKGEKIMLISEKSGKALTIHADPDDPKLQEHYSPLKHLLYRQFNPLKQITIEQINEKNASESPYLDSLRISFEVLVEFKKVTLYRKLQTNL